MLKIRWNPIKNLELKHLRGISFDKIIHAKLITVAENSAHLHQNILIYEYKNYLWAVPCVITKNEIFLKTIYPSRKLVRKYNKKENQNEEN